MPMGCCRTSCGSSARRGPSSTTRISGARADEALRRASARRILQRRRGRSLPVAAALCAARHQRPGRVRELAKAIGDPCNGVAIFLSTAPSLFKPAIDGLEAAGWPARRCAWRSKSRSAPTSTPAARSTTRWPRAFPEERTFRIDHYLGKETVQNLIALRFANSMFEPLWNSAHIDHVQITVAETVGVEGRGDYYDGAGALRDMVQNHMLQLLALVAMEPPSDFNATAVRDEKVKVLRALRPITAADAERDDRHRPVRTWRGRWRNRCPAMPRSSATTARPRRSSR